MRFKETPKNVEAIQFDGHNFKECEDFIQTKNVRRYNHDGEEGILIYSIAGHFVCRPGYWIIKNENGFYGVCDSETFETLYTPIIDMEKTNVKPLSTIQKNAKLNLVYVVGEADPQNKGHHHYMIKRNDVTIANVQFQNGPRNEKTSVPGVLDVDLLEIVRHRLKSFQSGQYATRENQIALIRVEEALLWLNKRVEDRIEEGKLGTNKI